ncbi:hypothetical protein DRH27_03615 [Candidatus Falkowbacteria bacterium]|nr:MAG: hypothetical protein DRH27_03615 [Candidatus Falkowbacteria bacterium]
MAPVVTVSFTADVECGVSPLTVNFTNTTTLDAGYQRKWLWTFGDGSISENENPSHVYTGAPGQAYDVSLAVLATDGAADTLTSSVAGAGLVSNNYVWGMGGTAAAAWAARAGDTTSTKIIEHTLDFNGASYFYFTNSATLNFTSYSSDPRFVIIEMMILTSYGITTIDGFIDVLGVQSVPTSINTWQTHSRLPDITSAAPVSTLAQVLPDIELVESGYMRGIKAKLQTRMYTTTAIQDYGESTETGFISLAVEPVASFTASPSVGANPLSVQFTNTSAEGCNTSPTYSWKRRITGSGDAFVEFSTSENPLTSFGKS